MKKVLNDCPVRVVGTVTSVTDDGTVVCVRCDEPPPWTSCYLSGFTAHVSEVEPA